MADADGHVASFAATDLTNPRSAGRDSYAALLARELAFERLATAGPNENRPAYPESALAVAFMPS
jgi:hypothetical protein